MSSNITKVAVIGTGVIGAGWIIRALAHNKKVTAFDKDIKLKKKLIKEIKRTWPYVKKLFNKKKLNLNKLKFVNSIKEAVKNADFIQECVTENYSLKTKLMHSIGKYAKSNAIISSSSSGLLPSRIYSKCKNPKRTMIGHPFNPVYMLPGVEIVPGKKTQKSYINKAKNFYKSIAMNPLLVKKELPGYLADRLQEALWREALHIVNEGYASTEDLDRSIEDGPGLRWSLDGNLFNLSSCWRKSRNEAYARTIWSGTKITLDKIKSSNSFKKIIFKSDKRN